jgi:DNA-binding NarL/FixJ family response regulator
MHSMTKKSRLLIVEDHTILREGLRALLSSEPNWEVVGQASDGHEAIHAMRMVQPDLIIMDLSMPKMNGIEAIQEIKARHPNVKILILTVHNTDQHIRSALVAGADGYVLKDVTHKELVLAIQSLLDNKTFLSPGIAHRVVSGFLDQRPLSGETATWEKLSHRERQIVKLVAEGNTNKDIAGVLSISPKTVEKHRSNLMKKLQLHNTSQLTLYAMEQGLISH